MKFSHILHEMISTFFLLIAYLRNASNQVKRLPSNGSISSDFRLLENVLRRPNETTKLPTRSLEYLRVPCHVKCSANWHAHEMHEWKARLCCYCSLLLALYVVDFEQQQMLTPVRDFFNLHRLKSIDWQKSSYMFNKGQQKEVLCVWTRL